MLSPAGGAYLATDDAKHRHHAAKVAAAQRSNAAAKAQAQAEAPQPATPGAALLASFITAAVTEPLDRVRFVQQASAAGATARSGLGFLRGFRVIADREGSLLALWRGLPSSVAASFATYFIRGAVSSLVARLGFFSQNSAWLPVVGSLFVGWGSLLLAAPLTLGRAAMLQVEAPKDEAAFRARGGTLVGAIRRIVKQRGVAALLTGVPAQMLAFTAYMAVPMAMSGSEFWHSFGVPPQLIAVPIGSLAALPFDVVRAVQMAAVAQSAADPEEGDGEALPEVPSLPDVLGDVVRNQGVRALFTGATAGVTSVVVAALVGTLSYVSVGSS